MKQLLIIMFCSANVAIGTELDFSKIIDRRDNFEVMYETEARLFLAKKHISLSIDFEKYVKQNKLEVFSCYALMERGKMIMVTIKYVRSHDKLDESGLRSLEDEIFKIPTEPYIVAEYRIYFQLAIAWWKIRGLNGGVYTGREIHLIY